MMDKEGNTIGEIPKEREDGSLQNFYLTYPSRLNLIYKKYTVVQARNYKEARRQVVEIRGSNWAFLYTEKEFEGQKERFDLQEIELKYPKREEEIYF